MRLDVRREEKDGGSAPEGDVVKTMLREDNTCSERDCAYGRAAPRSGGRRGRRESPGKEEGDDDDDCGRNSSDMNGSSTERASPWGLCSARSRRDSAKTDQRDDRTDEEEEYEDEDEDEGGGRGVTDAPSAKSWPDPLRSRSDRSLSAFETPCASQTPSSMLAMNEYRKVSSKRLRRSLSLSQPCGGLGAWRREPGCSWSSKQGDSSRDWVALRERACNSEGVQPSYSKSSGSESAAKTSSKSEGASTPPAGRRGGLDKGAAAGGCDVDDDDDDDDDDDASKDLYEPRKRRTSSTTEEEEAGDDDEDEDDKSKTGDLMKTANASSAQAALAEALGDERT